MTRQAAYTYPMPRIFLNPNPSPRFRSASLRRCASLFLLVASRAAVAEDLAQLEQQAFNAAADAVADCVVQIRTVGGLDQLGGQSLAQGPTTGLIVTDDGYIVSSAINFAQQPASVLVRLPGGEQRPAELIGRDTNRMLVLLKVDVDEPLPTPKAAPVDEVNIGDWAVAVGRTYDAQRVNLSVGVISAKNRMHGRAIQSDASASAANYGGPLVDLAGRVIGVLVPMAPQSPGESEANELAGAEFYDSGIAFAVPLAHIRGVLDRWIADKNLDRGLLGVGMSDGSPHATPAKITAVWPRSPAAAAGWKPGDEIVKVDGDPVASQTQLRFHVAPRYAGDALKVTLRRGDGDDAEQIDTEVTLAAKLEPFRHAFLGVLPMRDPPKAPSESKSDDNEDSEASRGDPDAEAPGLLVRTTWPGSPAAKLDLQPGDRITKLGKKDVGTLDDAFAALAAANPGDELKVVITRSDEKLELSATLGELPMDVLAADDLPPAFATTDSEGDASASDADANAPELEQLKLADMPQTARYYRPAGEEPVGLLLWLGDGKVSSDQALAAAWQEACDRDRLALVIPAPADAKGWSSDDAEYLARLLVASAARLGADPRRIVLAGEGKAGQLAYAVGLKARKIVRGIAVIDSPLPRTLELPQNSPSQRLAVLSVATQNAPLTLLIQQDLKKLADAGFPASQVVRRDLPPASGGQLDAATRATIARWIDGLDRL
jgi:serine protease Do